jgi:hypothetical protein
MTYHPVSLNLSDAQMEKLSNGDSIRLKVEQLQGGDDTVYLTQTQINKISSSLDKGVGMTLKMSATQIRHQVKFGSGRFTDFLSGIWGKLKDGAKALPGFINKQFGDQAQTAITDAIGSQLDGLTAGVAGSTMRGISNKAGFLPNPAKKALADLASSGLTFANSEAKQRIMDLLSGLRATYGGAGLFGDIFGSIPVVGKVLGGVGDSLVNNIGLPLVKELVFKKMTGRGAKATRGGIRSRTGAGLRAPGY